MTIDVTLRDTNCESHKNGDIDTILTNAAKKKMQKYRDACESRDMIFIALPFTALGKPSNECDNELKKLFGISPPALGDTRNTDWEEKRNYTRLQTAISGSCWKNYAQSILNHRKRVPIPGLRTAA